jgi:ABC-type branched-subunit amino acid transport system substrate-binding protein
MDAVFRRGRRRARWWAVLGAAVITVAACQGSSPSANPTTGPTPVTTADGGPTATPGTGPATGEPYKLGFTSDFSSNFGYLGLGLKAGHDAFWGSLNASGGIDNHPVELIALDDNSNPDRGTANVTQLITQENVSGVAGVMYSVICAGVVPLLEQYKVPEMCGVVSGDLINPVNPYVYGTTLEQAAYAGPQVEMARRLMEENPPEGTVKAAVIYSVGSAAIEQWATAVQENITGLGWELVTTERVPIDAIDMSAQISRIISLEPHVLILGAGNNAWVLAGMRQIAAAGNPFPVVSYDVPSWSTVKELNSRTFYYVASLGFAPGNAPAGAPGLQKFIADTAAVNVDPNGPYVIRGYLQAMIFADAFRRCGFPCSGEQLQAALDQTNFDAGGVVDGSVVITPSNHEPVSSLAAYQWDSAHTAPVIVASDLKAGRTLGQ